MNKQKTLSGESGASVDCGTAQDGEFDLPMATPLPKLNRPLHQFLKSIPAHLTVQKILGGVQQQSSLTFDYIFFCVLASILASLGLLENSTV